MCRKLDAKLSGIKVINLAKAPSPNSTVELRAVINLRNDFHPSFDSAIKVAFISESVWDTQKCS